MQQPGKVVGQAGTLDLTVTTPRGELSQLDVTLEQNGQTYPLFSLAQQDQGVLKQDGPDRLRLTRPIGRAELPQLKSGQATINVTQTSGHPRKAPTIASILTSPIPMPSWPRMRR